MDCCRYILRLVCLLFLLQPLIAQDLIVGEPSCLDVVRALRLPVDPGVNPASGPGVEWLDIDRTLVEIKTGLQGRQCRLKFRQIFERKRLDLFPLTSRLLAEAPEEQLIGLELWAPSGERLGTLEGLSTVEIEMGPSNRVYTFYYPEYRNQSGRLLSFENHLLQGEFMVRWNDLRERIAIDTLPDSTTSAQLMR